MGSLMKCGRCSADVGAPTFYCWTCERPLCHNCGNQFGHCGHSLGGRVDEESTATEYEGRRRMAAALRSFRCNAERASEVIARRPKRTPN